MVHIVLSVGWLGAVVSFLALTVWGIVVPDPRVVATAYLAAEPVVRFAIVPLGLGALLSGIIQSVGSPWGLFDYYWVLFKLMFTAVALVVLLQYVPTVSYFARLAAGDLNNPAGLWSYLLHSAGGLLILLLNTVLGVYKPPGLTPWARRRRDPRLSAGPAPKRPR